MKKEINLKELLGIPHEKYTGGWLGFRLHRHSDLGVTVPIEGYYKLLKVEKDSEVGRRKTTGTVKAYYNLERFDTFFEEEVSFNANFLYNNKSEGNKDLALKEGMIIQVHSASLSESTFKGDEYPTYKIVWEILYDEHGDRYVSDYDDYDDSYTQEDLDAMTRDAFNNDPSAQWNVD